MAAIASGRTVSSSPTGSRRCAPAPKIIGMQKGEIVEVGTHEELLQRRNGLYAHLWELQSDQTRATA